MRNKVLVLTTLILSSACGCVTCVHVEPTKAAWSGWTASQGSVSQTITCNFDSLSYIQLFAGAKGSGGAYTATVYDNGVQVMSSNGTQDGDCRWVRFDNWDYHVAFTKGRQLTVKFTRSGSDSIQFYYDNDPYRYGQLIVGQDTYPNRDLACRVYGRTKKVDSKPGWGAIPVLVVGSV